MSDTPAKKKPGRPPKKVRDQVVSLRLPLPAYERYCRLANHTDLPLATVLQRILLARLRAAPPEFPSSRKSTL